MFQVADSSQAIRRPQTCRSLPQYLTRYGHLATIAPHRRPSNRCGRGIITTGNRAATPIACDKGVEQSVPLALGPRVTSIGIPLFWSMLYAFLDLLAAHPLASPSSTPLHTTRASHARTLCTKESLILILLYLFLDLT